jgi:hypothetical protein
MRLNECRKDCSAGQGRIQDLEKAGAPAGASYFKLTVNFNDFSNLKIHKHFLGKHRRGASRPSPPPPVSRLVEYTLLLQYTGSHSAIESRDALEYFENLKLN